MPGVEPEYLTPVLNHLKTCCCVQVHPAVLWGRRCEGPHRPHQQCGRPLHVFFLVLRRQGDGLTWQILCLARGGDGSRTAKKCALLNASKLTDRLRRFIKRSRYYGF